MDDSMCVLSVVKFIKKKSFLTLCFVNLPIWTRAADDRLASQIRQSYHEECEAAINCQINRELYTSYVYISIYAFFNRDNVALKNFAIFFKHQSHEEREHAEKLMKFQNQKRGRVALQDVSKPDECSTGLEAMRCALHLERTVNQSPSGRHKLAYDKINAQMCDFLETHFLDEQVQAIKKLGDFITNVIHFGTLQNGMAAHLFGKLSLEESSS
ncbi:hypothetical protein scyTo_0005942 [Scyliorhinus torazame]|uniref:Ferritin n=1 Tax=Scyliorhinus torazame TaxID=75743 RepID=A0A401PE67_SCYTO|nr:hypothetical protein [Scyliorhinus torazame]